MCHVLLRNMTEKSIRQEFKLRKTAEFKNYFIEEIKQKQIMSKKKKHICAALNYIEQLLY